MKILNTEITATKLKAGHVWRKGNVTIYFTSGFYILSMYNGSQKFNTLGEVKKHLTFILN